MMLRRLVREVSLNVTTYIYWCTTRRYCWTQTTITRLLCRVFNLQNIPDTEPRNKIYVPGTIIQVVGDVGLVGSTPSRNPQKRKHAKAQQKSSNLTIFVTFIYHVLYAATVKATSGITRRMFSPSLFYNVLLC